MSDSTLFDPGECALETVIVTGELDRRRSRFPDGKTEAQVLLRLNQALAASPDRFFQLLVEAVMTISSAQSAGISLLNEAEQRFVWPAIAGGLSPHIRSGTPRSFGPCGTVFDRDCSLLMAHPERHFAYLDAVAPPLEEVLLVPFYVGGRAVGTIWAVIHDSGGKFDREDRRLLEELSSFAAMAYRTLAELELLGPLLEPKKD